MIKNVITGIALILAVSAFVISLTEMTKKPVFIDLGKVYQEFTLSKELNKDLDKVLKARKEVLDTLYQSLTQMQVELKGQKVRKEADLKKFEALQKEYLYKEEQFEKENQSTSTEYYSKAMNQLNQYVQEFGKENHCTILFGANGQGNIMYADDSRDLTKEVTEYINNRYNGQATK